MVLKVINCLKKLQNLKEQHIFQLKDAKANYNVMDTIDRALN